MSIQQVMMTGGIPPSGQQSYTSAGAFTWTAPAGVTSVCVVVVGSADHGGGALFDIVVVVVVGGTIASVDVR